MEFVRTVTVHFKIIHDTLVKTLEVGVLACISIQKKVFTHLRIGRNSGTNIHPVSKMNTAISFPQLSSKKSLPNVVGKEISHYEVKSMAFIASAMDQEPGITS